MSALRIRTVDAFSDTLFAGNPAAVAILDEMPDARWMQSLAAELNLSETAFAVPTEQPDVDYELRWFTPKTEVDLCGHATLATAHCLFDDAVSSPIRFHTRSGVLTVSDSGAGLLAMDFPARPASEVEPSDDLADALGVTPIWVGLGGTNDLLVELADEAAVLGCVPNLAMIRTLDLRGVIVTAPATQGKPYDFVSRFFAPNVGVDEDPVTGSAHTVLAPFWAERLGRSVLTGFQASARTGMVGVDLIGDRVILTGRAVTVLDATLSQGPTPIADDVSAAVVDAR
jgi:PhzF family phenazine biosynthesis protein